MRSLGQLALGDGGIGARALVKPETVGVRLFSNQRGYDLLPWKPSRYLRLAARPRLCAGTIISRNARCAPPPRDVYPYGAIRPLGGTGGWRRNRRLEFGFGRRATGRYRFWIAEGNGRNRLLDRRNRLRARCRRGPLAISDHRCRGRFIYRQTGVGSARRLQQGI